MTQFTDSDERKIRRECRVAYREEGNIDCPYDLGTMEALIWASEESRIYIEGMESI